MNVATVREKEKKKGKTAEPSRLDVCYVCKLRKLVLHSTLAIKVEYRERLLVITSTMHNQLTN